MKNYLPNSISQMLPLSKILVRSGFFFEQKHVFLDFSLESEGNRLFLAKLLNGVENFQFSDGKLPVPEKDINQRDWFGVWQRESSGAEGGSTSLFSMDLSLMDAYISGVVRWLTALGYNTTSSCDGHGQALPRFDLKNRGMKDEVSSIISRISNRRIVYASPYLCPNKWQERDMFYSELLDLAEKLHMEVHAK